MSARSSRSSTKYGPSVSDGVTMHVGVATGTADAEAVVAAEAVGADPVRVPPPQAATIAEPATLSPASLQRRREIVPDRRSSRTLTLPRISPQTWNPPRG